MADVIAFLIEHFGNFDACPPSNDLGVLLEEAGFGDVEIGNLLMLLEALESQPKMNLPENAGKVVRVYCREELEVLPQEVLGLLHYLEQEKAIDAAQREFVINALLFMPQEEVTVNMAKILALLVLWAHQSELPVLIGDDLMVALHGAATMH
ncbi:DUF494 domain-containing protein [Neisseria canis]|uniref:Protein Smg homolog n=1 Tax=Neisseria canis TaxID=493 RepID=A0A448D593_9NEIS|nr:DUF494 domain-containing protein [Neisseria canis]OSI09910.1 hypothetical protein BWD07_11145 [Neisseria canis]VEE99114.1 Protein smg-like protein [Neisseria canis]